MLTNCYRPWAIAGWAPSAFLGVEVNKLAAQGAGTPSSTSYRQMPNLDIEMSTLDDDAATQNSSAELSGIYFGILNVYTTLPQFVGTFISMIVFAVLEPGKSRELGADGEKAATPAVEGPNAISVCLFIGAMSTVVSAFVTRKLRTLD